jgi:transcriptional regulator with XRE-family HTH domain
MESTELLRAVRHLQGWSQRDLGARLQVSKSRVGAWEAGTRPVPSHVLWELLAAVGLDVALVAADRGATGPTAAHLRRSTSVRLLSTLAGRPVHLSKAPQVPAWLALVRLAREGPVQLTGPAARGVWLPGVAAPVPLPVRAAVAVAGVGAGAGAGADDLLDVQPLRPVRRGGTVLVAVARNAAVEVDGPVLLALDPECSADAVALRRAARLLHERAGRDGAGRRAPGHRSPREVRERRDLSTSFVYAYGPLPDPLDSRGWRVDGRVSLDQELVALGLPPRRQLTAAADRRLAG